MSNRRFAQHTRSASFALSLSNAQIGHLLADAKMRELADKYPWYEPVRQANFGDPDSLAAEWTTSTVRALVKKGLVVVKVRPLPCSRLDVVRPTRAGVLLVALLGEAGFKASPLSVPTVPPHPDDRIPFALEGPQAPRPATGWPDRRDPADAAWFGPTYQLHRPAGAR